ncbi:hypothetical protein EMIHUDRAFT_453202 [Emiliania huxleyi CCMP1516]|uniref:Uncharacterized protein n=2 Tax=Emiliania huxleyi TaxID=2903 RepID=A0A0D3IAE4_EMIH1|nr:hypothetical protein EMIHUDRAFT_453202 [Emiliania huxleyi CCMP1516]EOD08229.1 hypothetical protein EMIHUDRAFT_453202 [Emiliania huxleyi CCMP1516]|eukprot:XP_005760658.1 hypothetical protein EMIHUDRAFT_453202 [Emiliania huxleyi CCMP1516]
MSDAAVRAYLAEHGAPSAASAAQQAALDACTVDQVPILQLLYQPCGAGMHGFACGVRWGVDEEFLPSPRRWLRQWGRPHAALCQRGFFAALAAVLTRAHWEQEWDAQPFRIAAVPPRTMGKMVHQLATANYYHFTLGPRQRPALRGSPAPGSRFRPLPQPGFRWNVLDFGGGGREEIDFERLSSMPGNAAEALYNASLAGEQPGGMMQYVAATKHLRAVCHVGGPYCGGGGGDAERTPVAAVHVRQGDSCDRKVDEPGPWNAMWRPDPKRPGKLTREGVGRRCYSWRVYRQQLQTLRAKYGVRTVLLATDDHTGEVVRALQGERDFNWVYLDYPRQQFRKRAWMEFRSDLDENAPFSLAAELELLSTADLFVGSMGSHTSRSVYMRMVSSSRTSQLPPFISVDGYGLCCDFTEEYGLCCDFTEECTREQVRGRARPVRECIYRFGAVTGGEQWMYHRG